MTHPISFPPAIRVADYSLRWHWRPLFVALGAAVVLAVTFIASLMFGEQTLSLSHIAEVLSGGGTRAERVLLLDLRMNRAIAAALAGCALGAAGAVMQSVTRNPLASPDILGITAGASLGAVAIITLSGGQSAQYPWAVPLGALAGGLVVSVAIALASSGMDSLRMVLSGIAFSSLCTAGVTYALTVVSPDIAAAAFAWLAGSLNDRKPENLWPVGIALVIALPLLLVLSRVLGMLSLGPVRATTLGVPVRSGERGLLLISVLLASAATAAVGPVGFIAFVSPQIARRIAATTAPPLLTSGFVGGSLVLGADLLIRSALPWQPPIGAVTSVLGAPVLIYFLWKATRV